MPTEIELIKYIREHSADPDADISRLDDFTCCNGMECTCRGETERDLWLANFDDDNHIKVERLA